MKAGPRISPLGLALLSLGVIGPMPTLPRRETYPRGPELYPKPLTFDDLASVGAQVRASAGTPKREHYEMRPLAERKERRRKRKQRRSR